MTKIYLISPEEIDLDSFPHRLHLALKTGLVEVFQLRLKGYSDLEVKEISLILKEICHENNCLFILNDYSKIALEIGANGVHVGSDDGSIAELRKTAPKNFIIGASCYDSRHLAMKAAEEGADYISFGAFFKSQTKDSKGNPSIDIIKWSLELMNVPIVAIGGINDENCNELVNAGTDFISVISYVWAHPKGEVIALENLNKSLSK